MKKMKFVVVLFFLLVFATSASAVLTATLGSDADTYLRDATVRGAEVIMDVRGAAVDRAGYLRFNLSDLLDFPNVVIKSAKLTLTVNGSGASRNDTATIGRFTVYGLKNIAGNTPQNWVEINAATPPPYGLSKTGSNPPGAEWTGVVPLPDLTKVVDLEASRVAGLTETMTDAAGATIDPNKGSAAAGTTISLTDVEGDGDALVAFLQGRAGDGGLVTFIIGNEDASDKGYGLATKENGTATYQPKLELTYTPEPATIALLGLGGLALIRRKR